MNLKWLTDAQEKTLFEIIDLYEKATILELGCYTGYHTKMMLDKNHIVHSIDYFKNKSVNNPTKTGITIQKEFLEKNNNIILEDNIIDILESFEENIKNYSNITYEKMLITSDYIPDKKFDIIYNEVIINELENPEKYLKSLYNSLNDRGVLIGVGYNRISYDTNRYLDTVFKNLYHYGDDNFIWWIFKN